MQWHASWMQKQQTKWRRTLPRPVKALGPPEDDRYEPAEELPPARDETDPARPPPPPRGLGIVRLLELVPAAACACAFGPAARMSGVDPGGRPPPVPPRVPAALLTDGGARLAA